MQNPKERKDLCEKCDQTLEGGSVIYNGKQLCWVCAIVFALFTLSVGLTYCDLGLY